MTTDPTPHLFWITSRAAGTTALLLASASVCAGLMMGGKLMRRRRQPGCAGADRRVLHEVLSLATMVAIAVHGLTLLGDAYLKPSVLDISVPFVSGYKTGWTTLGIIAGWGMVTLGLAYYARTRIGQRRFRILHRFNLLFWALGLVHTLGEGTDAGQAWFIALVTLTTVPVLVLFVQRVRQGQRKPSERRLPARSVGASA
jgi:sulfoxide reductase heme-binding subunit YedZ